MSAACLQFALCSATYDRGPTRGLIAGPRPPDSSRFFRIRRRFVAFIASRLPGVAPVASFLHAATRDLRRDEQRSIAEGDRNIDRPYVRKLQ